MEISSSISIKELFDTIAPIVIKAYNYHTKKTAREESISQVLWSCFSDFQVSDYNIDFEIINGVFSENFSDVYNVFQDPNTDYITASENYVRKFLGRFPNSSKDEKDFLEKVCRRLLKSVQLLISDQLSNDTKYLVNRQNALDRRIEILTEGVSKTEASRQKDEGIHIDKKLASLVSAKWVEEMDKNGDKLSRLIPNLLPLTRKRPIYVHEENEPDLPIIEKIQKTKGHLYIIGEGGIGKTTAFYSIMKEFYSTKREGGIRQIPLYIELSKACNPDGPDFTNNSSQFIRNTIKKQFQEVLNTKEEIYDQLEALFVLDKKTPEYIFLLDGLNEVSRDIVGGENGRSIVYLIVVEIKHIIKNYKNVRIIVSSRSKENIGDNLKPLYLSGIDPNYIEVFLRDSGIPEERIKKASESKQLIDILRNPLFLTLYAKIEGNEDLLSRGEILHAFFTQKKDFYSERSRADRISDAVQEEFGFDKPDGSITPLMLSFMLDFVIPSIAWEMVRLNEFQIKNREIQKIVRNLLEDQSETSFCGIFGKECFAEYITDENDNTRSIANRIVSAFGRDQKNEIDRWDAITKRVRDCMCMQLGVLHSNNLYEYEMVHQHIRDYFAALYQINKLKLAVYMNENGEGDLARKCLIDWHDSPLPGMVLTFIGEALGELHNIPRYDETAKKWFLRVQSTDDSSINLIEQGKNIYRYRFDGGDGYAVWNLLQILKLVRKDLSGDDLTNLDLSNCRINGYRLGNSSFSANLTGSKLSDSFFLPYGHKLSVNSAQFSSDERYIVTASQDSTAKVWDARTYEEIPNGTLLHHGPVISAQFSECDNYIVTYPLYTGERYWDAHTFNPLSTEELALTQESVCPQQYSSDGKSELVVLANHGVEVRSVNSDENVIRGTLKGHKEKVNSALYSPKGNFIITASDDCTARIWDAETLQLYSILEGHKKAVNFAQFSPNEKNIVTASADGTAKVWDITTFEVVPNGTLKGHKKAVKSAMYSPKGSFIVTASADGTAKVWDSITYTEIPGGLLKGDTYGTVVDVSYSLDGNYMIIYFDGGFAEIRDVRTFELCIQEETRLDVIRAIDIPSDVLQKMPYNIKRSHYSPRRNYIIANAENPSEGLQICDANSLKPVFGGPLRAVNQAAFSYNEKFLVTASGYETVRLYGIDSSSLTEMPCNLLIHNEGVQFVDVSSKGDYILTISYFGVATLWTVSDPNEIRYKELRDVKRALFSPDGSIIFAVFEDEVLKAYDTESLNELYTFPNIPGLEVLNVDLRSIHPQSVFSSEMRQILQKCGATLD